MTDDDEYWIFDCSNMMEFFCKNVHCYRVVDMEWSTPPKLQISTFLFADTYVPCLDEIYENMGSMCERIQSITDRKDPTLWPQLKSFIHGRRNKRNTPFHRQPMQLIQNGMIPQQGGDLLPKIERLWKGLRLLLKKSMVLQKRPVFTWLTCL